MMVDMVMCLDAFTGQRTRLVVVVDGLDSCEQSKVRQTDERHLVGHIFLISLKDVSWTNLMKVKNYLFQGFSNSHLSKPRTDL